MLKKKCIQIQSFFFVSGGQNVLYCAIVRFIRAAHGDSLSLAILSVPARIWLFCGNLFISLCLSGSPTPSLSIPKHKAGERRM